MRRLFLLVVVLLSCLCLGDDRRCHCLFRCDGGGGERRRRRRRRR